MSGSYPFGNVMEEWWQLKKISISSKLGRQRWGHLARDLVPNEHQKLGLGQSRVGSFSLCEFVGELNRSHNGRKPRACVTTTDSHTTGTHVTFTAVC
ncbi:hypothetical protein VNO78_00550 [Psophocarpus tetragonolobus]|uniref:Uncharacterized protein n=1 Tax=Psophocarpus tetragonolobus TaxID=3891 RepID=A0AAN9SYK9_PSOTE